jgi:uncharacterized protein YggU (UPF0235/DUF167 family)
MAKRRAPAPKSAANHAQVRPADRAVAAPGAISVAVRVRPGAGATRVGGCYDGPHGAALIIAVGAQAVDGKATEAVRRALAEALGVRPAAVTLRVGATSRNKIFAVDTSNAEVTPRLTLLRDGKGNDDSNQNSNGSSNSKGNGSRGGGGSRDGSGSNERVGNREGGREGDGNREGDGGGSRGGVK